MKGKKTYLVGALAVTSAALLWWYGAIDTGQAATLIMVGLGLASLRHGLTSERIALLLELLDPYRPAGRPRGLPAQAGFGESDPERSGAETGEGR
ncbi:MAG: hypothetical protein ACE5MH_00510 [Terriglobia bacterium]